MKSIKEVVNKYYEDCKKTRMDNNIEGFQQVSVDFQTEVVSIATSENMASDEIKTMLQSIASLRDSNANEKNITPTTRSQVTESLNYAEKQLKEQLEKINKHEVKETKIAASQKSQTLNDVIIGKAQAWIKSHNGVSVGVVTATQMPLKSLTEDTALLDDVIDKMRQSALNSMTDREIDKLQNNVLRQAVVDRILERNTIDATSTVPGRPKISLSEVVRENNLLTKWLKTPPGNGLSAFFARLFGGIFEGHTVAWNRLEAANRSENAPKRKI